jgi:hypothetical protein
MGDINIKGWPAWQGAHLAAECMQPLVPLHCQLPIQPPLPAARLPHTRVVAGEAHMAVQAGRHWAMLVPAAALDE